MAEQKTTYNMRIIVPKAERSTSHKVNRCVRATLESAALTEAAKISESTIIAEKSTLKGPQLAEVDRLVAAAQAGQARYKA